MNTPEVVKLVAQRLDITQKDAGRLLKRTFEIVKDTLSKNLGISVPDLGTFSTHVRESRKSYLPHHKRFAILPPKRVIHFQPSSGLKEEVKDLEVDEND